MFKKYGEKIKKTLDAGKELIDDLVRAEDNDGKIDSKELIAAVFSLAYKLFLIWS